MSDTFGHVLIADDDAAFRAGYKSALEREGYVVHMAGDGEEATRLIEQGEIGLLVLDILMPRKDGIETLIDMKDRFPALTIIAVSAGGSRGETNFLSVAKKFGADATLCKPFTPRALLALMAELAKGHSQRVEQCG